MHVDRGHRIGNGDGGEIGVPMNLAAEEIRYELQWSTDLVNWNASNDSRFVIQSEMPLSGAYVLRLFRNAMPGESVYVRVRASVE